MFSLKLGTVRKLSAVCFVKADAPLCERELSREFAACFMLLSLGPLIPSTAPRAPNAL